MIYEDLRKTYHTKNNFIKERQKEVLADYVPPILDNDDSVLCFKTIPRSISEIV